MEHVVRQRIRVAGIVQGVGFRPYVWRLARELDIRGWVRNGPDGVEIQAEGSSGQLANFLERLPKEAPEQAHVEKVILAECPAEVPGAKAFVIRDSVSGKIHTQIGPDMAVCQDCLTELFDPRDRRYRYAFINCTQCGPRYTLTRSLPYDRPNTSMATFPLCPDCHREYGAPADRRFHAEPTACPACGPRLEMRDAAGEPIACPDPVAEAVTRLRRGEILAIKGLGGFHLVCDARNPEAVMRLRVRKAREEKPFALMLANGASLTGCAESDEQETALLHSQTRPIVLLRKHPDCDARFPGVAPGLAWIGVMLPYTPIHWLLFHEAAGRPEGLAWMNQSQPFSLVMTSANPGGEPLVIGNGEAVDELAGIADAFLMHDRDILVRCDDSVVRMNVAGPQFIRRARGATPRAIQLADAGPSVLALGGWFKNSVCLTRGDQAFVSQHIGDLDNAGTCNFLMETVAHLCSVLEIEPERVAHDLHPDFFSSQFAQSFAAERGLPIVGVQHHHAHIAAILAEHGVAGPVLGLALDGVGLGVDGTAWGGELLRVDGARFERIGRLRPLSLPGGDKAAREPWRMAAAVLHELGRTAEIPPRFASEPAAATVAEMLRLSINCPATSSMGRVFDAAAGLLGVRAKSAFEGQAAMLLEGLAESRPAVPPLQAGWRLDKGGSELDLRPLWSRLVSVRDPAYGARLFHDTLAAALIDWVAHAAGKQGLNKVVLGGGCFLNHILCGSLALGLTAHGFQVWMATRLPPNDGGIALGQAWVAQRTAPTEVVL